MVKTMLSWALCAGLGVALLWLGDWAVWVSRHSPQGQASVVRVVVAPLKGNKEEYYPQEAELLPCSQSLFAWSGAGACWWLRKHHEVLKR